MAYRPDELDDPARTTRPRYVPVEDGAVLFSIPVEPWQEPPKLLQVWGRTPFGEWMMAVRSGTMEEDAERLRTSMCDGLFERIVSISPIEHKG